MLQMFKKAKRSQVPSDWESFTNFRREYHQKELAAKTKDNVDDYNVLASNTKNMPEKWESMLIFKNKNSDMADTIPPIEQDDDIMTDDLDKATALKKLFFKH